MRGVCATRIQGIRSIGTIVKKSLLARVSTFPVSAIASFVLTGLIIRETGAITYGVVMLIANLFMMMPFADLGTGAVVLNAFSEHGRDRDYRLAVAAKVWRTLWYSAVVVGLAAFSGVSIWSWSHALGVELSNSSDVDLATAASLTLFALSVPASLGIKLLVGTGRSHVAQVLGPVGSVVSLILGWRILASPVDPIWVAIAYPFGILVSQLAALCLGLKSAGLKIGELSTASFYPLRNVLAVAAPMLVIMMTLPFAMQGHRVILSHRGSAAELAEYSLAMQFFQPLWSFIAAAGQPLWPMFASLRHDAKSLRLAIRRAFWLLLSLGLFSWVGLMVFGNPLGVLVSSGRIHLGLPLLAATGLLVLAQALQQIPGMTLTTAQGLLFQSVGAALATATSLLGSWALIPTLGASAPSIATAVGVLCFQTLPGCLFMVMSGNRHRLTAQAGAAE